VPLKLLHSSEVLLARGTSGLNDLVFVTHERAQVMSGFRFEERGEVQISSRENNITAVVEKNRIGGGGAGVRVHHRTDLLA
jgi:hypothetical protein